MGRLALVLGGWLQAGLGCLCSGTIPHMTLPPTPTQQLPAFTVSAEYAAAVAKGQVAAQAPAPGNMTTEFWLHVLALLVPVVLQAMGESQNVLLVAGAQVAASLYTLARTWLKAQGARGASAVASATVSAVAPVP